MNNSRKQVGHGGFTLSEVVVSTAIVGIAMAALMGSLAAGTASNDGGHKRTQAVMLAQEIREWTLRLPFSDPDAGDANNPPGPDGVSPLTFVDDLDDLLSVTFSPPRDGAGSPIADLADWSQVVSLTWQDPADLRSTVADGASDVIRVNVSILKQGRTVLQAGWLVTRRN